MSGATGSHIAGRCDWVACCYTFLAFAAVVVTTLSAPGLALAAPGDLDTSFGSDGTVTTPIGADRDGAYSVAIDSEGRIVAAGYSYGLNSSGSLLPDFALARYGPDGSLDASFGSGGMVTTPFSVNYDEAYSVAIDSEGRIVTGGYVQPYGAAHDDFALARYESDGSLDTSFDDDGMVTTNFSPDGGQARDVAIDPQGRIVAAGDALSNSWDFALARYNADGSLDTTFDSDGKVTTDFFGNEDHAFATAIDPEGRIVAAGIAHPSTFVYYFALARYNADGGLDTTFNPCLEGETDPCGGRVTTEFHGRAYEADYATSVAIDSEGRIVAAGTSVDDVRRYDFALARYEPDGSLDTSFGSGGKVTTPIGPSSEWDVAESLAIDAAGRIVAGGWVQMVPGQNYPVDFALARYNPDGSLETSFGDGGKVTTAIGSLDDSAYSLAIDAEGRIVLAGQSWNGSDYDFALARYLGADTTAPDAPTITATAPASPANHNNPRVKGTVGAGSPTQVKLYRNATCSGSPAATGTVAGFTGAGIAISVADDTTIHLSARASASGNDSACSSSIAYVEDSTAPKTTDSVDTAWHNARLAVTLTATDTGGSGVDKTYYTTGVNPANPTTASSVYNPAAKPTLGNGERIKYFSRDKAGNSEAVKTSAAAKVDTTAPDTTITSGPAAYINDPTPTFAFRSSEVGSTFACKLDSGTYKPCSSPKTLAPLADARHTFYVRATDRAGNTDPTPAARAFTVDTKAPNTTITSGPKPKTQSRTATFKFTSSELGSSFGCKLDKAGYAPCRSPKYYEKLKVGKHTFYVRATDRAKNTDRTPAEFAWQIEPRRHVAARASSRVASVLAIGGLLGLP